MNGNARLEVALSRALERRVTVRGRGVHRAQPRPGGPPAGSRVLISDLTPFPNTGAGNPSSTNYHFGAAPGTPTTGRRPGIRPLRLLFGFQSSVQNKSKILPGLRLLF
jgi:hypothetical protein